MLRAYEEIIDFIAAGVTPAMIAHFEASQATKDRVAGLIAREKSLELSSEETSELKHFRTLEHVMRLAKARAAASSASSLPMRSINPELIPSSSPGLQRQPLPWVDNDRVSSQP